MRVYLVLVVLAMTVISEATFGKEIPVQARLFAGSTAIKPADLNTELTAQSLKTFDSLPQFGVEITYPVWTHLNIGFRYSRRISDNDETTSSSSTDYLGSLSQDSVLAVLRVPVLKSDYFRLDAFGGAGGSNTTFKIKTVSQDGELTRREGGDWFASPCFAYGGSISVGYKRVFLAVEAGMEVNKVDEFKRQGTVNNNVQAIDLSGGYFLVGLVLDGIPGIIN